MPFSGMTGKWKMISTDRPMTFPGLEKAITTGFETIDHANLPEEEKKRVKKIIHFNGKDWMKCDQCGTMTSEMPCHKCGGSPVKDLDSLWNAETVNEPGKKSSIFEEDPSPVPLPLNGIPKSDSYFRDSDEGSFVGAVSLYAPYPNKKKRRLLW